jgi:hypothetical protein
MNGHLLKASASLSTVGQPGVYRGTCGKEEHDPGSSCV